MNNNRLSLPSRMARGFTLIEMMIAVAIVGMLAAVAYPSYTDYVRRSSLADAFQGLSGAQVKMEQYYQDNRSYANSGACGYVPPNTKYFNFTCVSATASAYKIRATGVSTTAARNHVYTIDQANAHVTETFNGTTISAAPGNACWLTKSASEC